MLIKSIRICNSVISVFKELNFVLQEEDYLCIIGENGSGKTTLMKILLGQLEGYKEYLENLTKSKVDIYIYSILDETLKKL